MREKEDRVPGPHEPDPENLRQRSYQGGADGIGEPATDWPTYGDIAYKDGDGPAADVRLPAGAGSGLSGLPQADAGTAPPLWDDPDSAPAPSGEEPREPDSNWEVPPRG